MCTKPKESKHPLHAGTTPPFPNHYLEWAQAQSDLSRKVFQIYLHYAVTCRGTSSENAHSYKVVIIQYSTQPESSGVSLLFAESRGPDIIRE